MLEIVLVKRFDENIRIQQFKINEWKLNLKFM
jgi:hypothetical protein